MPTAVDSLLTQFSIESVVLFIILIIAAVKCVSDLCEWAYSRIKKYFDIKDEKEERHEEIMEKLNEFDSEFKKQSEINQRRDAQIERISSQLNNQEQVNENLNRLLDNQIIKFTDFENQLKILNDRTQDSTRAYIIDKHHHFCYQVKAIDDMSLQDLERRFMYYKAAGGNTFIDSLMDEVRSLPRLTLEQLRLYQMGEGGKCQQS